MGEYIFPVYSMQKDSHFYAGIEMDGHDYFQTTVFKNSVYGLNHNCNFQGIVNLIHSQLSIQSP